MKNYKNNSKIIKITEAVISIICLLSIISLAACLLIGENLEINIPLFNLVSVFIALFGIFITVILTIPRFHKQWEKQAQITKVCIIVIFFIISLIFACIFQNNDILRKLANPISYICVIFPLLIDIFKKENNDLKT